MASKIVRANAKKNTGLNWFFAAFKPEVLTSQFSAKAQAARNAHFSKPSSNDPRKLGRLKKRGIIPERTRKRV